MDALHTEVMDVELKEVEDQTISLLFRRVESRAFHIQPHKYTLTHTHTCSYNDLPHQLFSSSQFIVCNILFLPRAGAGLFRTNKQELCCTSPSFQNLLNKNSCCLHPFCMEIIKEQGDWPALSLYPAAAAHLYWGMGELALVRGLQRGQRRDSAEDHSVQRTHCLTHHQGCAAQWCPETGTVSFVF